MIPTDFTPKLVTVLRSGYSFSTLKADILAGLTVAIVALPLAMALAIASNATPGQGLVTAIIAGALISMLGGSRVQIGGPTGAFVVVVAGVIAAHGYDGLLLATLMAGVILVVAGYARLGILMRFIPQPVITGFTAGIAVIIATSQVKDFLGLPLLHVPAEFIPKWQAYFSDIGQADMSTLGIGIASIGVIVAVRRFTPRLPAYLLAVVTAVVIYKTGSFDVATIGSRFPDVGADLWHFGMPDFSYTKMRDVLPSALTIAFLAGIEALLSATVADGMSGFRHRSNQELVAQGVANVASALCAGLPATGAIARTATNIRAGGRTPVAGIFHALFLLIFVLFGMDLVAYIPMAALAAILFTVAFGMSEHRHFVHLFKMGGADRVVLVLTFLLTVFADLTVAIGVGVIMASLLFMRQMSGALHVGANIGDGEREDPEQRDRLPAGVEVFQIAGPLFFGDAHVLAEFFRALEKMPRVIIIRMRLVPYLDATGAAALRDMIKVCNERGARVVLSGLRPELLKVARKGGLGETVVADDYQEALTISAGIIAS